MAFRPQLTPHIVFPSAEASPANTGSMGASFISAPTVIQKTSMISYEVVWSGGSTPVGTISVQVSNNFALNANGTVENAGTWETIPLVLNGASVTSIPVSGNSGDGIIEVKGMAAFAIRLIYTRASGSGTMEVTITGKVA